MTAQYFEDLGIWQDARDLSKKIYSLTRMSAFSRDYRFVSQITAAAGSIMDNIAEGFERGGNKEFLQFLSIAKGSCGEVRSQLHRAFDAGYIDKETYDTMVNLCKTNSSSIYFFMQSIKNSTLKGSKYSPQ